MCVCAWCVCRGGERSPSSQLTLEPSVSFADQGLPTPYPEESFSSSRAPTVDIDDTQQRMGMTDSWCVHAIDVVVRLGAADLVWGLMAFVDACRSQRSGADVPTTVVPPVGQPLGVPGLARPRGAAAPAKKTAGQARKQGGGSLFGCCGNPKRSPAKRASS